MAGKTDLKKLTDAVRQAEAELETAATLTAVKAAAKKLMRAKEELKAARDAANREGESAGAS